MKSNTLPFLAMDHKGILVLGLYAMLLSKNENIGNTS